MTAVRIDPDPAVSAFDAVTGRRSVRRFLPDPVPDPVVVRILAAASRAPSGQNMQPWLVHAVTGDTRARLCREVANAVSAGERSDEYDYFPAVIREPYRARRRRVGFDLFAIYGIGRDDQAGRQDALLRNFDFFGAPVGLFFTMERDWGYGAWIDMGNFMTNVMTLAPSFGLATCPQQAWAEYGAAVRRILPVPEDHMIVSGMALGVEDTNAAVNGLITERAKTCEFLRSYD
ncbi:MAG: nitroreductase [Sphingobium sp.]|uniref:nitroreductase n=1 Tax=Sphingobium sp. TaxID=1912891 RepID=UPI0029A95BC1|nr:nitroreductase [Sphingobium sp.]MDX3911521.1 nitroreductase [Sphingobium sp.]